MIKLEHIIRSWAPIAFVIRKSKKLVLPRFGGLALYDVLHFFRQQIQKIGLQERAAAISFNVIMSIPPALIFLCTLIPYFPISKQFKLALYALVKEVTPNQKVSSLSFSLYKIFWKRLVQAYYHLGFY